MNLAATPPAGSAADFTPAERRFLLLACGVIEPDASSTRPGATPLTAEGVLALRAKLEAGPSALLLAARAVHAVRPSNWDDSDDPQAVTAWTALHAALAPRDDDDLPCGICSLGFVEGDRCLTDVELGPVHADCCGPERESYVGADGEPLKDGEPIPTPWMWTTAQDRPRPLSGARVALECAFWGGLIFFADHVLTAGPLVAGA